MLRVRAAVARAARRARPRARLAAASLIATLVAGCAAKPGPTVTPAPAPAEADANAAAGPGPREAPRTDAAALVLRGAKVMTAAGDVFPVADVWLEGGRIVGVGPDLEVPSEVPAIDARGKVITPGIIDTHSHIGVYAAPGFEAHEDGNEIVGPNTAYVRAADGYWPQDPQITRAVAGGITTMQILPGSANLIGGRSVTVKPVPGALSVDDARFPGAPEGLKIACGENPKRVYGERGGPYTRMGNLAGFRAAFQQAAEYQRGLDAYARELAAWEAAPYDDDGERTEPPEPPARDFALETLAAALRGEILVHNHCYRADEMLQMMQLAEAYGFKIRSFHHAVEAYKIADAIAAHDGSASVWADWWGFKVEAYDGVRENAAILASVGARAIIHSDSATGIQRLNQEAAKAMYAGRRAGLTITDDEALRWITANAAWALGIDKVVGTLEPGKMADVVVWDGSPWSVYAKVDRVYMMGELIYERGAASTNPRTDFELGLLPGDTAAAGASTTP